MMPKCIICLNELRKLYLNVWDMSNVNCLTSLGKDVVNRKCQYYRKTSNISRTLVGNKIVGNSDVVGAAPTGAAPTTSSFST